MNNDHAPDSTANNSADVQLVRRRRFLRGAVAGGGAIALAQAFGTSPAAAADTEDDDSGHFRLGWWNDSNNFQSYLYSTTTSYTLSVSNNLADDSGNALAVEVTEASNAGNAAVFSTMGNGNAIYAGSLSASGTGSTAVIYTVGHGHALEVVANNTTSDTTAAVFRHDGSGRVAEFSKTVDDNAAVIYAETPGTGIALDARSTEGRGGSFRGAKAQIRLYPSTESTHPSTGKRGDLFVDSSGNLWFAKGPSTWVQLA